MRADDSVPGLRRLLFSAAIESDDSLHAAEFAAATEDMYVSGFGPEPRATVDKQWIRDYQQVDHRNPDTYSINGYLAVRVLAEAARRPRASTRRRSRTPCELSITNRSSASCNTGTTATWPTQPSMSFRCETGRLSRYFRSRITPQAPVVLVPYDQDWATTACNFSAKRA